VRRETISPHGSENDGNEIQREAREVRELTPRPYSSRLRIVVDGESLKSTDPRVPEALRSVIDESNFASVNRGGQSRTDPDQFILLLEFMTPIIRDIEATAGIVPDVEDISWDPDPEAVSVIIGKAGIKQQGVRIWLNLSPAERLADLARQVQEWQIETQWRVGGDTSWPNCPIHPGRHPMAAEVRGESASWCCPELGTAVGKIGELDAAIK
jgi:hypothetical protein